MSAAPGSRLPPPARRAKWPWFLAGVVLFSLALGGFLFTRHKSGPVRATPAGPLTVSNASGGYLIEKYLKSGAFAQCPNAECKFKKPLDVAAPVEVAV